MGYTVEITELTSNIAISTSNPTIEVYYDTIAVTGATGNTGANGVSVSSATVNGSGNLVITLSNATTLNAGYVKGDTGATGAQGIQGIQGNIGATGNTGAI